MPSPDFILSEYQWDGRPGVMRYRRLVGAGAGQFVPRQEIRRVLDTYIDNKTPALVKLGEQLRDRQISLVTFQNDMEAMLVRMHLASAAAARGGWDQMTAADFAKVGQELRGELMGVPGVHRGMAGLVSDIENGLALDGRFIYRLKLYAQSARHTYHAVQEDAAVEAGYTLERNIRHVSDSCPECIALEGMGWQALGTLPLPGDRLCLSQCKCTIEYR